MTYPIPPNAMDDRHAIVGTAGSGKTYMAGTAVERLLSLDRRCVIIDPLDVWWGLRLTADGKTASPSQVPIFGGAHGDLPLTDGAGALIGETAATIRESCIVSLGSLGTKASERRFMLAFLTAFYRFSKGQPVHLIIDEADMFAPQRIMDKEGFATQLLGQMETVIRRGRVRGIIPWLITQRPAVLNKDVLSQADGLIAMKLTGSHDRKAIGAWIEGQADREAGKDLLARLPTMQIGEGLVWIPGHGVLGIFKFPNKTTFDSSRTLARGKVTQAALKPIDLGMLEERLASIVIETKANDPKVLRAQIANLKKQLQAAGSPPDFEAECETAFQSGHEEGFLAGLNEGQSRARAKGRRDMLAEIRATINSMDEGETLEAHLAAREPPTSNDSAPPLPRPRARVELPKTAIPADGADEVITGPQQRVLDALGWWSALGNPSPNIEQLAFVAGYSPTSGGFANIRGALRGRELVTYGAERQTSLTEAGAALAAAPAAPPSRGALQSLVLDKLTIPQRRVLFPLIEAWPNEMGNIALASLADYSPTSGGFANLRGSLRTIGCITYPGPGASRAADWLFP